MFSYNKHIIILGSARSGTSWFSEIIALQHRYRLLFEPEHETNTPKGKLICDRYITDCKSSNAINNYLKQVFSNRVNSDWIAQLSNRKWKRHLWPVIPKKFIIKFVRCNLAASYFSEFFDIPVIFIIRNPYDVIASQRRVQFPWLYDLHWFKHQNELCDVIHENYNFDLRFEKEKSDFEILCLRWCIENSVPLLGENKKFEIFKYEEIKDDINVFLKICETYNLKPLANINSVFKKPSSKTHKFSEINTGIASKRGFSSEEYKILNHYLDIFKIHIYEREF
ncbi:MAG: sulfotransferase family protein [Gelidibacter sp.]